MTTTDELCRLLNEAGVEYKVTSCHLCSSTEWECDLGNAVFYEDHTNGYTRVTIHYKDGMTHFQITSDLKPPERYVTPEQAIAATLGRGNVGKYVGLRQGEYWERTENSDYYCGGCGWKVTDHDSYCPECGGALHKAALDSSNCSNSEPEEPYRCHECSEKPVMALPKELRTVESQVSTACILMAIAMESTENENERLKVKNSKLLELVLRFRNHTAKCTNYTYNFGYGDCALGPFPDGGGCCNCRHVMCGDMYRNDLDKQLRELGVEVDE